MSGTANGGVLRLDALAVLRLRGSATRSFLSRQLTCDLAALAPDHPLFGAWLTPKGRALALLRLLEAGDGTVRAVLPAELADDVVRRMRMFVLREDVGIERLDGESAAGLWGGALEAAAQAAGAARVRIAPVAGTPPLGLAVGPSEALASLLEELIARGAERLAPERWELLQIRAGIPEVVAATGEAFVPQMINLDVLGAVSFHKGCYPGQEIVARTQHLGRIKRRAFLARCDAPEPPARPGDALVAQGTGDGSGRVVRAARHEQGQEMLAVLPLEAVSSGVRFHLGTQQGPAVDVAPPPYGLTGPSP